MLGPASTRHYGRRGSERRHQFTSPGLLSHFIPAILDDSVSGVVARMVQPFDRVRIGPFSWFYRVVCRNCGSPSPPGVDERRRGASLRRRFRPLERVRMRYAAARR